MPYECSNCGHFEAEGASAAGCPNCGGRMRMTMLCGAMTGAMVGGVTATAWKNPYINGFEVIEAPWKCRYAQLAAGLSTYWFVYRWGPRLLAFLAGTPAIKMSKDQLATMAIAVVVVQCLGALAGGVAAGFWARAWALQGITLALGVTAIPLAHLYFGLPKDWTLFGIALAASAAAALLGAYAGHHIVKPTRIPTS